MIKTKTIAKGKCFGSPARQRDSLVEKVWFSGPGNFLDNLLFFTAGVTLRGESQVNRTSID